MIEQMDLKYEQREEEAKTSILREQEKILQFLQFYNFCKVFRSFEDLNDFDCQYISYQI